MSLPEHSAPDCGRHSSVRTCNPIPCGVQLSTGYQPTWFRTKASMRQNGVRSRCEASCCINLQHGQDFDAASFLCDTRWYIVPSDSCWQQPFYRKVQAFSNSCVTAPPSVRVMRFLIPVSCCDEAATHLIWWRRSQSVWSETPLSCDRFAGFQGWLHLT
ncbi:hypothetical protein M404DRAFT_995704 [Pisolithus tinctorius Marx 270]|uniref:Uncharacterized protein n=1 Tax=Pisolithus tinctorius Marx 270 TaxID=870435 RepID=A0A0C3PA88_PISTI|nr:hypothetical protein M404DRAFT_995704 [Pisolithus tinctorius Marx 270]